MQLTQIPKRSEEEDITYEIDSVYGDAPIKISIYRNNFFLRSFDPYGEFDDTQKYYSNGSLSDIESCEHLFYNYSAYKKNRKIKMPILLLVQLLKNLTQEDYC